MKKCPKCHVYISEEETVCFLCGTNLIESNGLKGENRNTSFDSNDKSTNKETTEDKVVEESLGHDFSEKEQDCHEEISDKKEDEVQDDKHEINTVEYNEVSVVGNKNVKKTNYKKNINFFDEVDKDVKKFSDNVMQGLTANKDLKKLLPILLIVIGLLIIPFCLSSFDTKPTKKDEVIIEYFDWNELVLKDILPKPKTNTGNIISNDSEGFAITVDNVNLDEFTSYCLECENFGFNIKFNESNNEYAAYNNEGYLLNLHHYTGDEMKISLSAPEKYELLDWDSYELLKVLPKPSVLTGKIETEDEDALETHIGQIEKDEYLSYILLCKENGFTKDAVEEDSLFEAKSASGYTLSVEFVDYKKMIISISKTIYDVSIDISCDENFIFSKYDVNVYVNDERIGKIYHGTNELLELDLKKGEYSLLFKSNDDSSIKGSAVIEVGDVTEFKYNIHCYSSEISIKEYKSLLLPISSNDCKGKSYQEVVSVFENAGFTNVKIKEIKDLELSDRSKTQLTTSVKIKDTKKFDVNDRYFDNTKITIYYHSLKEVEMTINASDFKGMNYNDAKQKFIELGFTDISFDTSSTIDINRRDTVKNIKIGGSTLYEGNFVSYDDEVVITYYKYVPEDDGNSTVALGEEFAKNAFENYGERYYPYGFKCHWIVGLINKEQWSDGSWYFKVEVTCENEYGNKFKSIAEGVVSGSNAYPVVSNFWLSSW